MDKKLTKLRSVLFVCILVTIEMLKLFFVLPIKINIFILILQGLFDFLFILFITDLIMILFLRTIEGEYYSLIKKIINPNKGLLFLSFLTVFILFAFYYNYFCFFNGEMSINSFFSIDLCLLSSLFSSRIMVITGGEFFVCNGEVYLQYKQKYIKVSDVFIKYAYIITETSTQENIKIKIRKEIQETELIEILNQLPITYKMDND